MILYSDVRFDHYVTVLLWTSIWPMENISHLNSNKNRLFSFKNLHSKTSSEKQHVGLLFRSACVKQMGVRIRYARVLTASFALLPRVLDEQHPSRPVIIPIITRNPQIRDIFTEIRTA